MGHLNLENQMFLLNAIKETNEHFGEDIFVENEFQAINKIDSLFNVLENMENKLNQLSSCA